MGQLQEFRCPQCEYQETVTGGMGFGMETVLVTISCRDCERLFDAVADQKSCEIHETEDAVEPTGLVCPKNAAHFISLWEREGPCPKCGTSMEAGQMDVCWD